eukprot:PhF_6_TR32612/c0_g2_i1/m.48231
MLGKSVFHRHVLKSLRLPSTHDNTFPGNCLQALYQPAKREASPTRCLLHYNCRPIITLPCTIGTRCLRVPFLVDEDTPQTYLHELAFRRYALGDTVPATVDGYIRTCSVLLCLHHDTTTCLNVLGTDVLGNVCPEMLTWGGAKMYHMKNM